MPRDGGAPHRSKTTTPRAADAAKHDLSARLTIAHTSVAFASEPGSRMGRLGLHRARAKTGAALCARFAKARARHRVAVEISRDLRGPPRLRLLCLRRQSAVNRCHSARCLTSMNTTSELCKLALACQVNITAAAGAATSVLIDGAYSDGAAVLLEPSAAPSDASSPELSSACKGDRRSQVSGRVVTTVQGCKTCARDCHAAG